MGFFDKAMNIGTLGIWDKVKGEDKPPGIESQQVARYTPAQQRVMGGISNVLGTTQEDLTRPATTAPFAMSLPKTPEEQAYFESYSPERTQEFWESYLKPEIQSNVRAAYAGPGYWGSARAGAEVKALQDVYAPLMYQEHLAGRTAKREEAELSRTIGMQSIAENIQRWQSGEEVEGAANPLSSPYLKLAFDFLGLESFDTVAAMNPGSDSLLTGFAKGLAGSAGKAAGSWMTGGIG